MAKANTNNSAKKRVEITETVLRDAHQSLIATRMTTDEILPIVEKLDKVDIILLKHGAGQHLTHVCAF